MGFFTDLANSVVSFGKGLFDRDYNNDGELSELEKASLILPVIPPVINAGKSMGDLINNDHETEEGTNIGAGGMAAMNAANVAELGREVIAHAGIGGYVISNFLPGKDGEHVDEGVAAENAGEMLSHTSFIGAIIDHFSIFDGDVDQTPKVPEAGTDNTIQTGVNNR